MKKTIYHGSDHIIEKPQYGYGKPTMTMALASTAPKTRTWQRNGA